MRFLWEGRMPVRLICFLLCVVALPASSLARSVAVAPEPVQIQVHLDRPDGVLKPVWANVGHDEPNYTYSPEGQALLGQLGRLSPYAFHDRTHNLLTTGNGTPRLKWGSTNAYTRNAAGKPVYDWKIVDHIFDTYKATGIVPYVEVGFMPKALSSHPEPYQSRWPKGELFTGWSYPPSNYRSWATLVNRWVRHMAARYGRATVAHWDWEVWNEPDIGYWHGSEAQYNELYDYTAQAVKQALPGAPVGGPATTGPDGKGGSAFLRAFLTHVVSGRNYATGKTGAPLDFISFHAKGITRMAGSQAQMDLRHNLQDVAHGFAIVASYPTLRKLPIIISESDPEGCAACAASLHPENAYRNTPQYASYEAELFARTEALAARYGVNLQGYVTWAFTFPGHPYFYGYRSLATHGIDKPVMNAFRMFGRMPPERVQATSSAELSLDTILARSARATPDVGVLATRSPHTASILVWNYDDDSEAAAAAPLQVRVDGLPEGAGRVRLTQFRVDDHHSDAYTAWQAMGSPQHPTAEQVRELKAAGQLHRLSSPAWLPVQRGATNLGFTLPRQGVELIRLQWMTAKKGR
jgi:xylan 1,4-beta-xylosidase